LGYAGETLIFGSFIFLASWSAVFTGGFQDFVVKRAGKLWRICGELRGKHGELTVTFAEPKTCHFFQIYF
jgi:hypothetical protein